MENERRSSGRLQKANRLAGIGKTLTYVRYLDDFAAFPEITSGPILDKAASEEPKTYVVQTSTRVIERCILMATDSGDLVLDPTCGSGTTAYVAEQWGRRWITIDTSRVALALARARIMGARYPLLSARGQSGGTAEGSGDHPHRAQQRPHLGANPPGLRLRAGSPHHPQVHCQQRRDRRHLGEAPGDAGASARRVECRTRSELGRMGDPTGTG